MRFIFALLFAFIIGLVINFKVKAITSELNSSTLKVEIGEISKITYNFNYSAYSSKQVIEKISYKFPFKDITELSVTSNGKNLQYEFLDDGDLKVITLLLGAAGKDFQVDPKVELSFKTGSVLKKYPKGHYFYLPPFVSDYAFQKIDFNIDYKFLGYTPTEVYTNQFGIDGTNISGSTDGGILAFWEEMQSFNVIFPKIQKTPETQLFLNLPIEEAYDIYYIQNPTFDFGLVDSMGNRYGVSSSESDLSTSFFAKKIDDKPSTIFVANKFPTIDLTIYPELANLTEITQLDKLKLLNSLVIDNLSPILLEETDLNLIDSLQTRIDGNSKLTSFEYCYYLGSLASTFEIKSRITYGYSFFNSTESLSAPHIWCEFLADSQVFIADPWAEDVYKVHILGTNSVDRFKYGYWNQDVLENNLLGITNFESDNIVVEIKSGNFEFDNEEREFNVEYPSSIKSGELNNLTLKYKKEFLFDEIKNININGIDINYASDRFKLAFAPNSINTFKLKFDPGTFVFFTPLYYLQTNLTTTNSSIFASGNANILPNTSLTLLIICIALGSFIFLISSYKYKLSMIVKLQGLALRVKSKYTRRA